MVNNSQSTRNNGAKDLLLEGKRELDTEYQILAKQSNKSGQLREFIEGCAGTRTEQECFKHLFELNKQDYDLYLAHHVGEVSGAVSYTEFSHAVDQVVKHFGFKDFEDFHENLNVESICLSSYVRPVILLITKHPIVQRYILRKDVKINKSGTRVIITDKERKLLEQIRIVCEGHTKEPTSFKAKCRIQERGCINRILEEGTTFAFPLMYSRYQLHKLNKLKIERPEVYQNVFICTKVLTSISEAFPHGFELVDGLNYILCGVNLMYTEGTGPGHAPLYILVINKDDRTEKLLNVLRIDSSEQESFSIREQIALDLTLYPNESVGIIGALQGIQTTNMDASCSYYAQSNLTAFLKLYQEYGAKLSQLILQAQDGNDESYRILMKFLLSGLAIHLPQFYNIQEETRTDEKTQKECEGYSFELKPWKNEEKPLESREVAVIKERLAQERRLLKYMLGVKVLPQD